MTTDDKLVFEYTKMQPGYTRETNVRSEILTEADNAINGDRNVDYGDPTADFARTARYWNEHLCGIFERYAHKYDLTEEFVEHVKDYLVGQISAEDVAIMMMLLKVSRLSWSPDKRDHWVDAAGYAACGAQCADNQNQYKGGLR